MKFTQNSHFFTHFYIFISFLLLQSIHHPDKLPNNDSNIQINHQQERHKDKIDSALINKAYETLKDPLKRSKYLLMCKTDLDWTDNTIPQSAVSQDLLLQVWEIQSSIQEACADNDQDLLMQLKAENDERIRRSEARLASMFDKHDLQGAKMETISLNYWKRMESMINDS